jgi:hypothetical protein
VSKSWPLREHKLFVGVERIKIMELKRRRTRQHELSFLYIQEKCEFQEVSVDNGGQIALSISSSVAGSS